jgi:hypothetical protein
LAQLLNILKCLNINTKQNQKIMKALISTWRSLSFMALMLLSGALTFAQEAQDQGTTTGSSSNTVTTTTSSSTTDNWYAQPWVWIVGGAVLLLLLVALLRGGSSASRTDRVTVTKTVDRDTV